MEALQVNLEMKTWETYASTKVTGTEGSTDSYNTISSKEHHNVNETDVGSSKSSSNSSNSDSDSDCSPEQKLQQLAKTLEILKQTIDPARYAHDNSGGASADDDPWEHHLDRAEGLALALVSQTETTQTGMQSQSPLPNLVWQCANVLYWHRRQYDENSLRLFGT